MLNRIALLDKYNVPGGRYTYFPFHSKWNNQLTFDQFNQYLREQQNHFVDVYIHIPFCHSLCTFCGCNIKIMKSDCDNQIYINYLLKEWELYPQNLKIKNLFIGGGTPNFLHHNEIKSLLNSLPLTSDCQITIELDPRYLKKEDLIFYKELGIKRLSIGIQDFNHEVLKNVNRDQNDFEIIELINYAHSLKFENINLDFIYGLNHQTVESFSETISKINEINATSISLFPFAKVPWQNNSQKAFGTVKDFSIHELNEMFVSASIILEKIGYKHIGMGYFSNKNETIKRNIMGFTPKKEDVLIGLGVSSISSSPIGHMQNEKVYDRYIGLIKENRSAILKSHLLKTDEFNRQKFFEKVICEKSISFDDFELFKIDQYLEKFTSFEADNILIKTNSEYLITELGIYFLKSVLQSFDPDFISLSRQ